MANFLNTKILAEGVFWSLESCFISDQIFMLERMLTQTSLLRNSDEKSTVKYPGRRILLCLFSSLQQHIFFHQKHRSNAKAVLSSLEENKTRFLSWMSIVRLRKVLFDRHDRPWLRLCFGTGQHSMHFFSREEAQSMSWYSLQCPKPGMFQRCRGPYQCPLKCRCSFCALQ